MFGRGQGIAYGGIPKLLAPEISLGGNYVYDKMGRFYSTTTIYGYIKREDCVVSYETLLAIMNSSLCWWFLKNTGTVLANGYFRYKPTYLKPFPIPSISKEQDILIKELVERLQSSIHIRDSKEIEQMIEHEIFEIYDLTPQDRTLVLS